MYKIDPLALVDVCTPRQSKRQVEEAPQHSREQILAAVWMTGIPNSLTEDVQLTIPSQVNMSELQHVPV